VNREKLAAQLEFDEGRRKLVYKDTVGKLTVGIGRNITDRPFSDDEIDLMLKNDIATVERGLDRAIPWWRNLDDVRQNVIANMAFNMGVPRLLGFSMTLDLVNSGRFDAAAEEMLRSRWAEQVGDRAKRLSTMMRKGTF
jgi:lysozyme